MENINHTKIVKNIAEYNTKQYNYSKLCEELFELGEVCMKTINKKQKSQPPIEKIIEEVGDVIVRIRVLCQVEGIFGPVSNRIGEKLNQIQKSIDKQQYKGGI